MATMTTRPTSATTRAPAAPPDPSAAAGTGDTATTPSALGIALDRVGDRWSLLIVEALLPGARRFNELGDAVTGIAPNILSDRLRRLERAGILVATPYSRRPVRMEYALSADGRELAGALHLLADWGVRAAAVRASRCATRHAGRRWRRVALPHLRAVRRTTTSRTA